MSAHYSTREPSGCVGCFAALVVAVGMLAAMGYACYGFVTWMLEKL